MPEVGNVVLTVPSCFVNLKVGKDEMKGCVGELNIDAVLYGVENVLELCWAAKFAKISVL